MGIGTQEILIILVVVLVLFGSRKLPEIGSGLGRAIQNFKKASIEPDEIDITPQAKPKKKQTVSEDDEA
ncbi:twin-arginine translocase TatA/TatE family subunit [Desulfovibrio sp. OttesenSCG-928-F20]|nr:twin-arginine translocase TatA/TatE family subunit [Desulfovibrio sp. OttesenSCG-928-M16]MDL2290761.1 twin-arginine translocase TatA/TatE family subunit [Desulfovibrio sp. OttesenSCG-928-F20]